MRLKWIRCFRILSLNLIQLSLL